MGDRAEVQFVFNRTPDTTVWLYSHWGGADMPIALRDALAAARPRWGDESYCCRIMVSHIIPEDDHTRETGWGLAPFHMDSSYAALIVDLSAQTVTIGDHSRYNEDEDTYTPVEAKSWLFEDYTGLSDDALEQAWGLNKTGA